MRVVRLGLGRNPPGRRDSEALAAPSWFEEDTLGGAQYLPPPDRRILITKHCRNMFVQGRRFCTQTPRAQKFMYAWHAHVCVLCNALCRLSLFCCSTGEGILIMGSMLSYAELSQCLSRHLLPVETKGDERVPPVPTCVDM